MIVCICLILISSQETSLDDTEVSTECCLLCNPYAEVAPFVVQDEFACEMFEEIIRYHILCEHELCGSEATVSNHEGFSSHLNVEQMNKVPYLLLLSLFLSHVCVSVDAAQRWGP